MPSLILTKLPKNLDTIRTRQELTLDQNPLQFGRISDWPLGLKQASTDDKYKSLLASVSRTHLVIRYENGGYTVEDNQSRNGTSVNDVPLKHAERRRLKNGDRIQVCDFELLFQDYSTNIFEPLDEDENSTVEAAVNSLQARQAFLEAQPKSKLDALLEISTDLSRPSKVKDLLPQIAQKLLSAKIFPQADRCFILKLDDEKRPYPVAAHFRQNVVLKEAKFSRTIVRKCLERGEAIILKSVKAELGGGDNDSLISSRIRSAMCAPLLNHRQEPLGVIQIDSTNPLRRFTEDDLRFLSCVAAQCSIALDNAQMQEALLQQTKQEEHNRAAKAIQKALLPHSLPNIPDYEFFAYYKAAQIVGGDYYDFIIRPDGKLVVFLGDVSGKGVPAALLMARLSAQTREALQATQSLAEAMAYINSLWFQAELEGNFVTLTGMVIDPLEHTIEYVNAGHPKTWLYRYATDQFELLGSRPYRGAAIGLLENESYEPMKVQLSLGDCVFVYSDGVEDARNPNDERFDFDGVKQAADYSRTEMNGYGVTTVEFGKSLIAQVVAHTGDAPQFDDMTLVGFGRKRFLSSIDSDPVILPHPQI